MRYCENHWIEMRDKFESKTSLIQAMVVSSEIMLSEPQFAEVFKDPANFQKAIHMEGGCQACYYMHHLGKDLLEEIAKRSSV